MYKFIDLFCGIGGFRVALQRCGLECVFSCDIDKYAQESYLKNFGEKPFGDIKEISEKEIPKHDVLCAGFPCQSFSISGKMQGVRDDRGRLFYEIIRIAQYHQPYIMLLENVKNIISIDNGVVIKTIKDKLEEIGYSMHLHVLNASEFGVPQKRERAYFVCLHKDVTSGKMNCKLSYKSPKPTFKKIFLDSVMEDEVEENLYINRDDIVMNDTKVDYQLKPIRIGTVNKGGQGERIYSPKGHAITLSANGGGVGARTGLYLDLKNKIRRLSIQESKRVMGFSDKHVVSNGIKGYQQLGNAVIPSMIENVYNSVHVNLFVSLVIDIIS